MDPKKRSFLKLGGSFSLLVQGGFFGLSPTAFAKAEEWQEAWFSTKSLKETFRVMGVNAPESTNRISLDAPDTAENGAYVGVGVNSGLPQTEAIAILVDKNPSVLAGFFKFGSSMKPELSTKIKMAETSDVYGLVRAGGNYFINKRSVKVVLGGCGN